MWNVENDSRIKEQGQDSHEKLLENYPKDKMAGKCSEPRIEQMDMSKKLVFRNDDGLGAPSGNLVTIAFDRHCSGTYREKEEGKGHMENKYGKGHNTIQAHLECAEKKCPQRTWLEIACNCTCGLYLAKGEKLWWWCRSSFFFKAPELEWSLLWQWSQKQLNRCTKNYLKILLSRNSMSKRNKTRLGVRELNVVCFNTCS